MRQGVDKARLGNVDFKLVEGEQGEADPSSGPWTASRDKLVVLSRVSRDGLGLT